MRSRSNKILLAAAAAALTATVISGCSGGSATPASSSAPMSPSPSASPTGTPLEFDTTLVSTYSSMDDVGEKDAMKYGLNVLSGTTTIEDRSVRVKMSATLDNNDGSGTLGGFLTLSWSDGTTLGMRQTGTVAEDSSKDASYEADLEVIGGSAEAKGTTGTGTLTGVRKNGSSSLKIDVVLNLTGAPEMLTGTPKAPKAPPQSYNATIEP